MSKKNLWTHFVLSQEARYLGTTSFILKSSLAMFFAFWLGSKIPIANRDMISFLFGMMMSLEPISMTGFRRGLDQFKATLTGGLLSACIIAIFGINPLGLGLSIAAILYLTLSKNWRELSVVALFTGIYMTQFVQMNSLGQADILMTMIVRITALSCGILFAMFFNFIASFILSPSLAENRILFLKHRYHKHLQQVIIKLKTQDNIKDTAHLTLANLFNDIDWTLGLLNDLRSDPMIKIGHLKLEAVEKAILKVQTLRLMNHYLYDLELYLRS